MRGGVWVPEQRAAPAQTVRAVCGKGGVCFMKKEKQQKRPKRTKAQRVQALKTFAVDTVYDVVGSILFAIGVYTFAKSADFAPGGVSGLALICNYLWDLPIGTMTLIINIPIIIISYKVVGRKFLLKSFKTMVILKCYNKVVTGVANEL